MVHLKFSEILNILNIKIEINYINLKINDIKDLFHSKKMILLFFIQKNIKMLLKKQKHLFV